MADKSGPALDARVLAWVRARPRSRADCISRWGHLFGSLEDRGLVRTGERRVVMRGRFRDLTDTVEVVGDGEE